MREILIKMRADLWDDVKAGRIKVPIDKTYPLAEAKAGHEHMRDQPALRQDFADPVTRSRHVSRQSGIPGSTRRSMSAAHCGKTTKRRKLLLLQRHPKNGRHRSSWGGSRMLSRRNFINTTLAAGAALATQGTQTAMAQSKRMIVDAQAHLWKAESEDWKWVPGRKPQLPEPFTIEKLVPLMDEAGVDRVVIVPPSWPGDRNDYALEAARRYPDRFAVMGRIPLQNPESAELLPKWKEQPGMVGIRLTFQREQAATDQWRTPTGSGPRPRRPACRSCFSPRTTCRSSRRSPSAIPGSV